MSNHTKAYISVVIAMICWSLSYLWTKQALTSFPPITLITLRVLFASILLFVFVIATGRFKRIKKKDLKAFIILALFEPFLYFMCETYALTIVSPTLASVIIATIPIFAPIFAYLLLKEKISVINIIGIAFSLIGVFLVIYEKNSNLSSQFIGVLILFIAVFVGIIYTVILKKIPETYSIIHIVMYQSIISLFFFIPTFFIFDYPKLSNIIITRKSIESLVLLTIFASVIAFVCFSYAVRQLGVARTEVFGNLIPVFTAILSFIYLNENLMLYQWLGILIVLFGLFISQKREKKLGIIN